MESTAYNVPVKGRTKWKPGQSGNPTGNPSARPWHDALMRAVARRTHGGKGGLNAIADKLLDLAAEGDIPAIKEMADRLDGKAIQVIAGDPDRPLIGRQASEAQLEAIALGAMKVIEAEVVKEGEK